MPYEQVVPALAKMLTDSLQNETGIIPNERDVTYVTNQRYITNKIGYTAALSLLRTAKDGDASQVVRSLGKALRSKDRYVRAYATEALTHIRTDDAVDLDTLENMNLKRLLEIYQEAYDSKYGQ